MPFIPFPLNAGFPVSGQAPRPGIGLIIYAVPSQSHPSIEVISNREKNHDFLELESIQKIV